MKQSKKLQKNLSTHTFSHESLPTSLSPIKILLAFLKSMPNTNLLFTLKPNKLSIKNSKCLLKNQTKSIPLSYLIPNQKYLNNNSIIILLITQLSLHPQVLKYYKLKFLLLLFRKVFYKHEYNHCF